MQEQKGLQPKLKIDTRLLILAIVAIGAGFYPSKNDKVDESALDTKKVTLTSDVQYFNGRHSAEYYRFWTQETKAAFTIDGDADVAVSKSGQHIDIRDLKKGDTIVVKYYQSHEKELQNEAIEIPVHYLARKGKVYFTPESLSSAQAGVMQRYKVFFILIGLLVAIRAFGVSSRNVNIIGGIVLGLAIILRILNII